jgi:ACS family glucarate transporter-like MFS transporter
MTDPASTRTSGTWFPIRYILVFWLLVISAAVYVDRINISIASTGIGKEFSISNVRLGWVYAAFLVGYAGLQIPAGVLARRLGPRLTLGLLGVWRPIFILLIAFIPHGFGNPLVILIFLRFALGAGEATMFPATSQFVERWFPASERGKANGLIFAGIGLAGLTTRLMGEIILRFGWRATFGFTSTIGALAGLVWYLASRNTPEEHPWVGDTERALILSQRRVKAVAKEDDSQYGKHKIPWLSIFSSKAVLAVTLSYFAYGYVAWMFYTWFFTYMSQARGLNLKTSALYTMLPFIAMTTGCLLGGALSDWITKHYGARQGRCLLSAVSLAITAVLLVMGSRIESAMAAAFMLAFGVGVLFIAQSIYWAVAADISGEYVGVVSGIMNMGAQVGGVCTALLTPLIAAQFGWNASFATAAVIAAIGALAWLVIDPKSTLQVVHE